MYSETLAAAIRKLHDAEADVIYELRRLAPIGSTVRAIIMSNQQTPSSGTVIGYEGGIGALLRVRLESRTRAVRDIPIGSILSCKPPGK